ncbi:MAG: hypothetical protein KGI00_02230 [Candidatus Micrarchaeota archaeon]|nr:hypothetical protein [Candidatus Micrarchaeota archaeon]MDE1824038.1 hypothetical protein [Candidatus Micrarchaeota archaeon]MDE1849526.1 hypothetical protein [Candidatus Micrarchaeota archaeon]
MEQILIPSKRAELLGKDKALKDLAKKVGCKLSISDENKVSIEGEPYAEYNAKNVIQAFGRGFDLNTAFKLLSEDYFFEYINLKDTFRNREQMLRMKARIIGEQGRAKGHMESVSNASICVYGSTVSLIGTIDEINVAKAALAVLINGGTHKTAYMVMDKEKQKLMER